MKRILGILVFTVMFLISANISVFAETSEDVLPVFTPKILVEDCKVFVVGKTARCLTQTQSPQGNG